MANIPLKSIKFPDLDDTYIVPSNAGELPYNKSATYPADTVGKALQDKPDADGTIANAEQLTSNIYEEDSVPYNFRTSGGSIDIGDRETDMLVGGTVGWNQLVKNGDFSISAGNTFWLGVSANFSVENGVGKFVKEATNPSYIYASSVGGFTDDHVYFATARIKGQYSFVSVIDTVTNANLASSNANYPTNDSTFTDCFFIYKKLSTQTNILRFGVRNGSSGAVGKEVLVDNAQLIDLTKMLGSTIADYIYSLEQATAGAGVAWFKKLFPKPYYAYNAGELMSVNTSAHNTVGFNAWDEEWENGWWNYQTGVFTASSSFFACKSKIAVFPNTEYYWKCPTNVRELQYYDANGEPLGSRNSYAEGYANTTFTTPDGCYYLTFYFGASYGTTYNNDICINLSWDGERDGEYEAYVKHSYPLDSSLTLRGIPKLDANNNLYYDGDTYESDGTVTRKYGIVDLGTLNWMEFVSDEDRCFLSEAISDMAAGGPNTVYPNIVCGKYPTVMNSGSQALLISRGDKVISTNTTNKAFVYDSAYNGYTAASFKTAMSGVYLVYELATPTTETADPYTNPQIVNDFGTEEYVDYAVSQGDRDVSIPVGHYTEYMANLKAKLEMSPNSPEGAGDYIVRQTNGENEYVTLASNATIQDIIARLEALENAES